MTSDESTWAWWQILWATEGVILRSKTGTASHLTDQPHRYSNVDQNKPITGGILHQNTCGHGYTPDDASKCSRYHDEDLYRDRRHSFYTALRSKNMMGASPSERTHRYKAEHKRWSSK